MSKQEETWEKLDSDFDHYLVDMKPYVLKLPNRSGDVDNTLWYSSKSQWNCVVHKCASLLYQLSNLRPDTCIHIRFFNTVIICINILLHFTLTFLLTHTCRDTRETYFVYVYFSCMTDLPLLLWMSERQRCALWIKKLCDPVACGSGLTGRKNRNMYTRLLLHMLRGGVLEGPFTQKPDGGSLKTLPTYLVNSFSAFSAVYLHILCFHT